MSRYEHSKLVFRSSRFGSVRKRQMELHINTHHAQNLRWTETAGKALDKFKLSHRIKTGSFR